MRFAALSALFVLVSCHYPLFVQGEEDLMVPVIAFQDDGLFSNFSYAMSTRTIKTGLRDFTMCFRVNLNYVRGTSSYVVSYAVEKNDNALTAAYTLDEQDSLGMEMCKLKYVTKGRECLKFALSQGQYQQWNHMCMVYGTKDFRDDVEVNIRAYLNGEVVAEVDELFPKSSFRAVPINGAFVLAQEQDSVGGNFDVSQGFSGQIAQFGIWNRVLDPSELTSLAKCENDLAGNILDYNTAENWTTNEVLMELVPLPSLCGPSPIYGKVFLTEKVAYNSFRSLCDMMHGTIPVLRNELELIETHNAVREAFQQLKNFEECAVGIDDVTFHIAQVLQDNGFWKDPYTNQSLMEENSVQKLETVDPTHRCAYVWGHALQTRGCDARLACGVCTLPKPQETLKLKGLCALNVQDDMEYDIDYYIHGHLNGKIHFRGIMNSHIYFDKEQLQWRLQSLRNPDKFLLMKSKNPKVLPIGTKSWILGSDNALCAMEKNEEVSLTLSTCFPNKYTCDSGDCIPLSDKCNTEIDCKDKSDEYNCDYLKLGANYAKELIPRDEQGKTFNIYLNISVLALPYIETSTLKFTADFYLNLRWYDLRIDFRDLNNITLLNSLNEVDQNSIWTPRLAFVNALGPYQTVVDEKTAGVLVREDDPLDEDVTLPIEAMLFSGRTNSILMTREYYLNYGCDFDLRYYPFDTQMCQMIFEVQGKTDDYVRLVKDGKGIEFLGGRKLVEYEIQLEELGITSVNRISRAVAKIVFRRRMEFHVTNTFLQTFILIGVGYMSLYFDVDNFTDRIMVTLTTMLVVATITSTIQDGLPKTSYYKLIDWWLLFSLNMLVLTMALHTYVAHCCFRAKNEKPIYFNLKRVYPRTESRDDQTKKLPDLDGEEDVLKHPKTVNRLGKLALLCVVLLFNGIFWTVALNEYLLSAEHYLSRDSSTPNNQTV